MKRVADLIIGATLALVAIAAVYAFAPDLLIPPRLTCAVRSADGCLLWTDPARAARYQAAQAGTH